ncbi:MAG: phage Gp37/Gp68 family protein [Gammaproteobacteria bacterium]|nr:phage Gp37/Gp68 family protein [Gammaproteobacteria bacterium]
MTTKTRIEWTELTWNPVTGCTKLSQGCKHCYAERMAKRLKAMGNPRYPDGFEVRLHEDLIDAPRRWKKPARIFVNSMSDLFHEAVPEAFIQRIFETLTACPRHTFQILTKRSERLERLGHRLPWPPNVWMGVSVENIEVVHRIDDLRAVPAAVRFLSCEPLIGPLPDLDLAGIHWLIVGGESGPGARPMLPEWVRDLREQCHGAGTAFFFKQWGGVRKDLTGRLLDGRTHDALPRAARAAA